MQKEEIFLYVLIVLEIIMTLLLFVMHPRIIRLPVVEIDGTIIYIHSLQFGSNITVTLEDIDGNIIYNVITITEVNMSFLVTQDILNRAHSITIYIDAEKYSGEI